MLTGIEGASSRPVRRILLLGECLSPPTSPEGRTEAGRRLQEANKLLDEVSNMLGDVRRELLDRR